jgi:hypothetical protein
MRQQYSGHYVIQKWNSNTIKFGIFSFFHSPLVGQGFLTLEDSRPHSSRRVISSSQRPLPGNTQPSQLTDIHAPEGIRTHNPSKRAAANPRLRPRGHWHRLISYSRAQSVCIVNFIYDRPISSLCKWQSQLQQQGRMLQAYLNKWKKRVWTVVTV